MRHAHVSLMTRVIIFNVVLLVAGIGSFTLYHLQRQKQHMLELSLQHAHVLLSTIEQAIATSMCMGNTEEVQTIIAQVGQSPHLLGVRIFSPDGRVLRSSDSAEIGQPVLARDLELFRSGNRDVMFSNHGQEIISVISPVYFEPSCLPCHGPEQKVLGVLGLHVSLADTHRQLQTTTLFFLISTLIMVGLLAAGISWVLLRFVQRPIRHLAGQMAQVERGDLSVRAHTPHKDEIGQLAQSFNSMVDNLEKARVQLQNYHYRQMEKAERLASVGEMATGIAHEIKNPLTGISAAISVLADSFDEDDQRKKIVGEVLAQIARLNKTATDLLHFGRPARPELKHVDINDLIGRTLFFAAQHPEARNVERILRLADDLPAVWIDEKQIQQVLFNIIINAMQAMSNGGRLTIETAATSRDGRSYVKILIGDSGPGIDAEHLEQIFSPFFTTKSQGTGLGLAICRQLLEQHQGRIFVESQKEQGTCFTIELPVDVHELITQGGETHGTP